MTDTNRSAAGGEGYANGNMDSSSAAATPRSTTTVINNNNQKDSSSGRRDVDTLALRQSNTSRSGPHSCNQDQDAGHSGEDTPPATPTIAVAQSARLPAHEPQRTEQSVAGVQAVNDPAPGVLVVTGPADAANSLADFAPSTNNDSETLYLVASLRSAAHVGEDAEPHAEVLHNPDTTERSSSLPQNLELANQRSTEAVESDRIAENRRRNEERSFVTGQEEVLDDHCAGGGERVHPAAPQERCATCRRPLCPEHAHLHNQCDACCRCRRLPVGGPCQDTCLRCQRPLCPSCAPLTHVCVVPLREELL